MLRYYMDHHVPSAITSGLRRKGIDCLTAAEDGAHQWDDDQLLERATGLNRILFSQDVDHLVIAASWQDHGRSFAGLVYGKQLQVTIGSAIRDLELIAHVLQPVEIHNNVIRIPL